MRPEYERTLTEIIREAGGAEPGMPVRPVLADGHAVQALLDAARDADLLVVGSRGHGGLASAVLGSVSLQGVLHARCPVLVLRDGREGRAPDIGGSHGQPTAGVAIAPPGLPVDDQGRRRAGD